MTLEVHTELDGQDTLVGQLYAHRRRGIESASFVYDESWIGRPGAYALEPQLPLRSGSFQTRSGQALFGCFSDSAPDRWGRNLIKRAEARRAQHQGGTARSLGEMDFLIGVRDDLRQGALRFRHPGEISFVSDESTGVPHLVELPALLAAAGRVERDGGNDSDLALLLRAGSSLGGARPKAHVLGTGGRLAIAKFPSRVSDEWDVMAWEKVALSLAELAGINACRSSLQRVARRNVLIVDRFDRDGATRIGYASAMTMLERQDGGAGGSYLEIAATIEQLSHTATRDLHDLWSRIALSILISNTDDHLRNHGFLYAGAGRWNLSPAFDLNPNPDPGPKHLSTAIDFDDTTASIETLLSVAESFRLGDRDALLALARVERSVARWAAIAKNLQLPRTEIARVEPAFEHEQRRAAQQLVAHLGQGNP